MSYEKRLHALIAARGSLCVGVDPHESIVRQWGYDYDLAGVERHCRELIAAIGDRVALYKPQSAFFERFGSEGLKVLARVIDDIRSCGAMTLLDVKRGDIGSTMDAYAHAYLDDSDMSVDAITVSPYLGIDALHTTFELAHRNGRGVYVLCRTSNPSSEIFQLATSQGRSIAQHIVDAAVEFNRAVNCQAVGLVIGATLPVLDVDLGQFQATILAPGLGAQGAGLDDLDRLFNTAVERVIPTVSRGIASAGPDPDRIRQCVNSWTK